MRFYGLFILLVRPLAKPKFILGNVECNKDDDCLFGQKCHKNKNKCKYAGCNNHGDCAGFQKCRGRKCVPICKYVLFIPLVMVYQFMLRFLHKSYFFAIYKFVDFFLINYVYYLEVEASNKSNFAKL